MMKNEWETISTAESENSCIAQPARPTNGVKVACIDGLIYYSWHDVNSNENVMLRTAHLLGMGKMFIFRSLMSVVVRTWLFLAPTPSPNHLLHSTHVTPSFHRFRSEAM